MMMNGETERWDDLLSDGLLNDGGAGRTYPELLKTARRLKRLRSHPDRIPEHVNFARARIAVTGNQTLSFVQAPLEVHLAQRGILADVFTGEFGNFRQELLAEDSALYDFQPEAVIIVLDRHAVCEWPPMGASAEDVQSAADRQIQQWAVLWDKSHARCGASIIQTNIVLPSERPLGHFEACAPWSTTHYLRRLNQLLAERAPSYLSICDTEHLSGCLGKRIWFDEPEWYNARQTPGFKALPTLTHGLAAIVAALRGKSRKCLVLDLDNTLWGGVVGDVGVEGLRLGQGDPVGEAFLDFQRYCRRLNERGVLLAVCSKNHPEIARTPFDAHPEMVLKVEDFSAFVANWEDKATNLRRIAKQLNLGLDSLVFVDDNPAERDLVRRYAPEVAVPELPADPALYRRALDEQAYFEIAAISEEDQSRAGYYRAEEKRRQEALTATDYAEFLNSLQQQCTCGSFDEMNLKRIVQLINKTNQWNLTTERMTEGQVRARMTDPSRYTLWVRHRDRFGDSGLIAVLVARQRGGVLEIEQWAMSCRVINRGIEDFIFNETLEEARRRGLTAIEGTYRPTTKNGLVSGLYETLSFDRISGEENETTRWRLDLAARVCPRPHFIDRTDARIGRSEDLP